jgi:very-short-patch-repair endonuclease
LLEGICILKITKYCLICRKDFETYDYLIKRKRGKYCNQECYYQSLRKGERRICIVCSKEFYALPQYLKVEGWGRCCSLKCKGFLMRKERTIINCAYCGKIKQINPRILKEERGKYCSLKCTRLGRKSRVKRICMQCGIEFEVWKSTAKKNKGKFCSKECMYSNPLINSIHRIHRLNQTLPVNDTLIERKMKGELDKLSLKYDHPFVISNKKYGGSFDFAFPEIKLAVECDGIYNHSRPKDILRDIRKTQFCSDNDWRLLRFTDQQIKKDLPSCIYAIMFYYYVRSHNLEPNKVNSSKDPKCQQGAILI